VIFLYSAKKASKPLSMAIASRRVIAVTVGYVLPYIIDSVFCIARYWTEDAKDCLEFVSDSQ
jgi:ABC-type uncharacterized transport system permease subunit